VILIHEVAVPAPPDIVFGLLNDVETVAAGLLGQRRLLKELSRER